MNWEYIIKGSTIGIVWGIGGYLMGYPPLSIEYFLGIIMISIGAFLYWAYNPMEGEKNGRA